MLWQLQILAAWLAHALDAVQLHTIAAWILTPQAVNVAFALACLCAAFGMCPKRIALVSAALYIALALL